VSPERRPGDPGWKPSEEDVLAAQGPEPGLILRVVSVIPFILAGAFAVIAFVAWFIVLVLGVGTDRGAVWTWAKGKPAGEVLAQVGLLVLIGLLCAGAVALSIYATTYGVRAQQPRHFWGIAQGVFSALGFLLLAGRTMFPSFMKDIGLTGGQWYFAFGLVAFAMIVVGLRMRRGGDDEEDDADG
jgi:hypothetical protein